MSDILAAIFNEIRYMRFVYLAVLAVAFWGALRSGPRRSARPAVIALSLLFLMSWPPVPWLLNAALEGPYWPPAAAPAELDAIVVFSGGSFAPEPGRHFTYLDAGSNLRCRTAALLHAQTGRPPVVVCGPSMIHLRYADSVWDLMSRELESWGVPDTRIRVEREGRSTYEQSLHAADILRAMGAQRIGVVTEGFHMRRAAGCLRRQGFDVIGRPAGTRSFPAEMDWRDFIPSGSAIGYAEEAIREVLALAVYKATGRI